LKIQLEALWDKRTVDCPECETTLPASGNGFPPPLTLDRALFDGGGPTRGGLAQEGWHHTHD